MQIDRRLFLGSVVAAASHPVVPAWGSLSSFTVINTEAIRAICYAFSRIAWLRAPSIVSIDGKHWTVCSDQRVIIAVRGRQEFGVELDCETDRALAVRQLRPFLRPECRGTQATTLDELRRWCRMAPYFSSEDEFERFEKNVGTIGECYFNRDLMLRTLLVLDSPSPVQLTPNAVSTAMQIVGRDFAIYVMPLASCPENACLCPPFEAKRSLGCSDLRRFALD